MIFEHFIGTRFNLKVEYWNKTKNGNMVLSQEWLNHRFEIFEKYTLPSILNQSSKNFKWCIFFDQDTPNVFKKKIQKLFENYKFITPIFIDNYSELAQKFKSFIELNKCSASHVITTRIDNDDIIHRDFVKTIQSLFCPSDLCVIDLRSGFQMSIDVEPIEIRNYNHPFNAFLSVIEPACNFSTIYSRQHYHWKNEKTIIFKKQRLWIELSHDENYVNHRQVKLKRVYSFDNKNFSLSEPFHVDVFGAFIENLRIDLINLQLFIPNLFRKIKKIPFRARRWVLKNISRETKKNIRVILFEYNISRPPGPWPYISNRLKKYLVKNVRLHHSNETLAVIRKTIENKESGAYMRFGDGDIHLMNGLDDILNKCNDSLSREMKEAIGLKGKNVHKTLPISSNLFGFEPGMKDGVHLVRDIDALRYLAVSRRKINLKKIYSTTALHYVAEHSPEICIDFLKFLRKTKPIFVGNKNLKKSLISCLFGDIHIKTPSNNAYHEIDRIERELTLELIKLNDNYKVVVLAMGCSGRVLQKRILKKGFNVYLFDFGSLLDALNGDQTRAWVRLTGGPNYYKALLSKI